MIKSLLAVLILGTTIINSYRFAAGGGLASFSDDFNRADSDSLGANWTEVEHSDAADIASNTLQIVSGSFAHDFAIYTGTATTTANQYVKATINDQNYATIAFRYTNSSTAFYYLQFDIGVADSVEWYRRSQVGGSDTSIQSTSGISGVDASATFGVTVDGTGTSTVVRVWVNPTGLPTSASNWNGDTTPDVSFTNDPASPVDSGSYVGLGGQSSSASQIRWDSFFGGDNP